MERPGPDRWILEEYRRLGGERVSFGSDAHRAAEDIGRGAAVYRDYLRALGFDHLTVFRGRKGRGLSALTQKEALFLWMLSPSRHTPRST